MINGLKKIIYCHFHRENAALRALRYNAVTQQKYVIPTVSSVLFIGAVL